MLQLDELVLEAKTSIEQAKNISNLESIRVKLFGKRGFFSSKIKSLREKPISEQQKLLPLIDKSKKQLQNMLNSRKSTIETEELNKRLELEKIDVSLPGRCAENGSLHPITISIQRIEKIFTTLGFSIESGPEIEDSYHNFDALNISEYHPARTNQDTFWITSKHLLRTQTSSVQIRIMNIQQPPIRVISSGRVYRKDYDQKHTPMFHQTEGFIVDKNITFANLKWILNDFLNNFFEKNIQIRFRPSYFPFTKLSAEADIIDKNGKWLEILGCGMIDPNVLHNVNIDSKKYSGFAFGIGVERLTMLRYCISDIRTFFENDIRFLNQF
ncbi:Phenylalanine--tRNA ligase alpha subunit [Candidatus Providencia siddallii]|uniref:Phenylalanine--tRNA ligase alpha subunit n=1 Tax=Candidatus Providencia siddallii TaxID=1715285 RepID=A0A0M6W8I1_9GAMM|nr:Phenylalanine--tRNA ligase alpha subunit [Candidatus Providencia siddallii]